MASTTGGHQFHPPTLPQHSCYPLCSCSSTLILYSPFATVSLVCPLYCVSPRQLIAFADFLLDWCIESAASQDGLRNMQHEKFDVVASSFHKAMTSPLDCYLIATPHTPLLHVALAMIFMPGNHSASENSLSSTLWMLTVVWCYAAEIRLLGCEPQQLDVQPLAHQASEDSLHAVSRARLL